MFSKNKILDYARLYDDSAYSAELLGKSHNTVYKINGSSPFYLRLTSHLRRQKNELLGELDFVQFLNANGAKAASPIRTAAGELIQCYSSSSDSGYITAFETAEGLDWKMRENDSDKFCDVGKALGKIHRISRCYTPAENIRRRQYSENQHLVRAKGIFRQVCPHHEKPFQDFLSTIAALSKNQINFGLTHGDYLFSNYNISADRTVTVFDFDECEYSWFISDIAVCIYYFLLGGEPLKLYEKAAEGEMILVSLMSGYLSEYALPPEELRHLELFFTMRDYVLLSSIFDSNGGMLSPWQKDFTEYAYDRILSKRAFMDCDIETTIRRLLK